MFLRATFFDFDLWAPEESDKVENYRFLETGSYDFDEKRFVRTTLDAFSCPVIKINRRIPFCSHFVNGYFKESEFDK